MKDWLFYPLVLLFVAVTIYFALHWGGDPNYGDPDEGWVVEGTDLNGLTRSPGTELSMKGVDKAILRANFRADEQPSQGVFTTLSGDYSSAYGGRTLELTIRARAADENPAETFQLALLTVPPVKGRFGWRNHKATNEYKDFVIKTKLESFQSRDPVIYFGIWPDAEGKGGQIEIERISVKPID